jgi:hypothetical protein
LTAGLAPRRAPLAGAPHASVFFVEQLSDLPGFQVGLVFCLDVLIDRPHAGVAAFVATAIEYVGLAGRLRHGVGGRRLGWDEGGSHGDNGNAMPSTHAVNMRHAHLFVFYRFLLAALLAAGCAAAVAAPAVPDLLPLSDEDIAMAPGTGPACGCGFYASARRDAPLLLYWSRAADRRAILRDAKGAHRISVHNERYQPQAQYGERMVVFFADPLWQIQAIGTVTEACRPKRACAATVYRARLLTQYEGRAQRSTDVVARCGC